MPANAGPVNTEKEVCGKRPEEVKLGGGLKGQNGKAVKAVKGLK